MMKVKLDEGEDDWVSEKDVHDDNNDDDFIIIYGYTKVYDTEWLPSSQSGLTNKWTVC